METRPESTFLAWRDLRARLSLNTRATPTRLRQIVEPHGRQARQNSSNAEQCNAIARDRTKVQSVYSSHATLITGGFQLQV